MNCLQATDYRVEFTKWWVNEFKSVKFPASGTVFDYYIDSETKQFVPWTQKLGRFELDHDMPLQVIAKLSTMLALLPLIQWMHVIIATKDSTSFHEKQKCSAPHLIHLLNFLSFFSNMFSNNITRWFNIIMDLRINSLLIKNFVLRIFVKIGKIS